MRKLRILRGIGANAYDKGVIAVSQLVLVSLLAQRWGLELYGAWVLLATVPTFFGISDLGLATAAGTEMTILVSRGERERAVRTFQSAWLMTILSSGAMIALALAGTWLAPDALFPHAPGLAAPQARLALSLLLVYGIVALQGSILNAGFRCSGLFASGALWAANIVLLETAGVVAVVLLGGSPVAAAATLLGCRSAGLTVQALSLGRRVPWLALGLGSATLAEARRLIGPGLSIVALTLGQAAVLHGTVLALGAAAGAATVPVFTAVRTLTRIGLQATQLAVHAIMPEFSVAVARGDRRGQALMLAATLACAGVLLVPFALVLTVAGPAIVRLWTGGVIHPPAALMSVMAATVILGGVWNVVSNLILAMNEHARFTYPFLLLAAVTVPLSYALSLALGPTGAGVALLLMDATMTIVIARLSQRLLVAPAELAAAVPDLVGRGRALLGRARG